MPKSRSSSSRRSHFSPPQREGSHSIYWVIRERLEKMYLLHLILLVVMVGLAATLCVILANQQAQIDNLQFRLDYQATSNKILRQRDSLDWSLDDLDAQMASPSPTPSPQAM